MLDINLIFKMAGIGILIIILDKVFKSAGKEDYAVVTNLTGIVIILMLAVKLISKLFDTVRTLFQL